MNRSYCTFKTKSFQCFFYTFTALVKSATKPHAKQDPTDRSGSQ